METKMSMVISIAMLDVVMCIDKTKAARNWHLKDNHEFYPIESSDVHEQESSCAKPDFKFNYHQNKLVFGLLLFDFNDAVREGDGERLFDIYKLALLLYHREGHTKYAYVVLLHLVKVVAILPKFQAHRLKWNRFYNKYGGKGNNISLDFKKEQQNKVLKTFWRALGANINENNGARVAHAVEQLEAIVESVNADCNYSGRVGGRSISNQEKRFNELLMT
ncbi:uncharacterized protein [Montipora capricornis]|uniref:uncharacterized protein n=1 Tax=Montipora capricornis TaxID=246305 RepID=UPI0035F160F9